MALDFRAQMFGGNKRKINNRSVIEAVLHDPTRVGEVFACVKDDDAYVRMCASDALEKVCRANASIVQPLQTRVLNEMSTIDQPSVQWHYAQIVDQLHFTPQETAQVMSKLQPILRSMMIGLRALSPWKCLAILPCKMKPREPM